MTMVAQNNPMYRYRVDDADAIVYVDDWWLAFAKENGMAELNEASVIGHKIWEFISGEPTQSLYMELHRFVRASGNPITVPFRCDSPTLQRYMQVTISKQSQGCILYESVLLRTQIQSHISLLDAKQARSEDSLTMCSFCKRSLLEPSGWLELENISLRLRMFDQQTVPELHYTVCPACSNQVEGQRQRLPLDVT